MKVGLHSTTLNWDIWSKIFYQRKCLVHQIVSQMTSG